MEPKAMYVAAQQASEFLKSLANRNRLLIVCQLIEGERSVGQLADLLGIRDSLVLQKPASLRKDNIATTRREGQTIYYSIVSAVARQVAEALYQYYCGPEPICS